MKEQDIPSLQSGLDKMASLRPDNPIDKAIAAVDNCLIQCENLMEAHNPLIPLELSFEATKAILVPSIYFDREQRKKLRHAMVSRSPEALIETLFDAQEVLFAKKLIHRPDLQEVFHKRVMRKRRPIILDFGGGAK